MTILILPLMMTLLVDSPAPAPSAAPASADALADAVMKASGGDVWPKVKTIKFSFVVHRGNGDMRRTHLWDVKNHTDTITSSDGKEMSVNVSHKPAGKGDDMKAFGMWTNDTYWLLAPLKVKDPGVKRELKPDQEADGKTYHVLHLSFESVGMTPGDQYNLYVDPQTNLVRAWDYIPHDGKSTHFTWDGYQDFNGLQLSTEHKVQDHV